LESVFAILYTCFAFCLFVSLFFGDILLIKFLVMFQLVNLFDSSSDHFFLKLSITLSFNMMSHAIVTILGPL
jgi:hypothetical protein